MKGDLSMLKKNPPPMRDNISGTPLKKGVHSFAVKDLSSNGRERTEGTPRKPSLKGGLSVTF